MRAALADTRLDAVARGRLLPAAAEIALAIGDDSAAEQAVAELRDLSERFPTPVLRAGAATARAALALHHGEAARAVGDLRDACQVWRVLRAPGHLSMAQLRLAKALDALGDHTGAELQRAAARSIRAE
jgi:hypothetical protein